MPYTICTDIGGTKIYTGEVKNNRVIKSHSVKTEKGRGLRRLLSDIKKSIEIYSPEKVKAISISFAGPISSEGKVLQATNFPAYILNLNLKKIVGGWFKKPVFVEHDGICFTLAESILGAGKNYTYVVGLTIGTGLGGGFTVNRKIYTGYRQMMEMGHFKITEEGFRCSCGKYGHFESQVSGPALSKYYKNITGQSLSGPEIHKLSLKGDKNALKASQQMAHYLGIALASLANTLSPEIFVIGGGVSNFKKIIELAKKEMLNEVIYSNHKQIKLVKSSLGNDAHLLGADLVTKEDYRL